jgi:hypothetical protein
MRLEVMNFGWEQLAEDTQRERERLGYPPTEPLLRKVTPRTSISHYVDKAEPAGYIGSTSEIANFSTNCIRPMRRSRRLVRSFLTKRKNKWPVGDVLMLSSRRTRG